MARDKSGQMLGCMAALKWLFGTNVKTGTVDQEEAAVEEFGSQLAKLGGPQPVVGDDPIARAEKSIARLEMSTARADRLMQPARSLDEAMAQMFPSRGE